MKKSPLLITAIAAMGYLTLASNDSGPAAEGTGNRTQSNPNTAMHGCGQLGCHGANDANTTITVFLTESQNGTPVQNGMYKPATTYNVVIGGGLPVSASKYGFQITATRAGNLNAGTFGTGSSGQVHTALGNSLVEHSLPLSASSTYSTPSFQWVSPSAGAGTVTFNVVVNAVNGNGVADPADHASLAQITFAENTTSVAELSQNIRIAAYPNPATDQVNLKFEDAEKGTYVVAVMDMTGKTIHTQPLQVSSASASLSLESSSWASGLYMVRIMKDGAQRVIPVSKQ